MEHKQFYPRDGWCEHDPLEIVDNAVDCIDSAVGKLTAAGYSPSDVVSIGITNQRETTVVWDKYTGQPLHNAVVWLDLRTTELAKELAKEGALGQAFSQPAVTYPIAAANRMIAGSHQCRSCPSCTVHRVLAYWSNCA
eukprot:scaffold108510_cov44-Tisochrysis_lutea.AAC.1